MIRGFSDCHWLFLSWVVEDLVWIPWWFFDMGDKLWFIIFISCTLSFWLDSILLLGCFLGEVPAKRGWNSTPFEMSTWLGLNTMNAVSLLLYLLALSFFSLPSSWLPSGRSLSLLVPNWTFLLFWWKSYYCKRDFLWSCPFPVDFRRRSIHIDILGKEKKVIFSLDTAHNSLSPPHLLCVFTVRKDDHWVW